jgi:uncharacterized protein
MNRTDFTYDPSDMPDTPFPLGPSLILLGRRGSEAHGTWLPPEDPDGVDDRDLMGIVVPPVRWNLGLQKWEGADAIKGVWDTVLYDVRKYVRLLCAQNPNVLSLLWVEPEDMLVATEEGAVLVESRGLFRARDPAYNAFVGYAHGQVKKMTSGAYSGYMGAKRKALVERYGYDCKNLAHAVRLMHMGDEYLRTGELRVRRTWDVQMLKEIKRGGWSLERGKEYMESKMHDIEIAHEDSVLPEAIDMGSVEDLVIDIVRRRGLQ